MGSVPPSHSEVADELLHRLKLIETARGRSASPWRRFLLDRVKLLCLVAGAVLVFGESGLFDSWTGFLGVFLLAAGLTAFQDRSRERLDALVEYLQRTGQLSPAGSGAAEPSA